MKTSVKWILWVAALGAPIALAILSVEQNYRYGAWLDAGDPNRPHFELLGFSFTFGLGLLYGMVNVFKVVSPVMVMEVASLPLRIAGMSVFVLLSLFSAWNSFAVSTLTRAERAAAESRTSQQVTDLRDDHAALLARIKALGETRPVAQIEANLAAERKSRSWSSSKGCTDATGGDSRLFCTTFNRDTVGTGRAILFAIVFELAEAFSIVLAWVCRPSSSVAREPAPQDVKRCAPIHSTEGPLAAATETAPRAGTKTAATAAMSAPKSSRGLL